MQKKNKKLKVYLAQFNLEMPSGSKNEYLYFPLSVGLIWSYAIQNPKIQQNFELKEFLIRKEDPDYICGNLESPDIFCFSSYMWNHQYNLKLAETIKERYPNCKIIFGGPNVPTGSREFLEKYKFIDYAVYREGELTFTKILLSILGDQQELTGIGYRQKGKIIIKKYSDRIKSLSNVPSPYTTGLFDKLIEKYKNTDLVLNAVIETNRGCPFSCTFCDWGNGLLGKVKTFDLERVYNEILWCAKNKIEFMALADANFGAFKERDLAIARYAAMVKKQYGYPTIFDTNWHKNSNENIIEMVDVLMDAGMLRRYSIGFQSLNDDTLRSIKRKNIPMSLFWKLKSLAKQKNVQLSTDIMVPLPNDTKENFYDTMDTLTEYGVQISLSATHILENSEMNCPDYKKKYGLVTKINIFSNCEYVDEYEHSLIETNTMPKDHVEEVMLTAWTMELHHQGFTNLIAEYYRKRQGIKLTTFYCKLWKYFVSHTGIFSKYVRPLQGHVDKGNTRKLTGGIDNIGMIQELGSNQRKRFYSDIKIFCKESFGEDKNLNDLISLQYNYHNFKNRDETLYISCKSNLLDFILNDHQLIDDETSYVCKQTKFEKGVNSFGNYIIRNRFQKKFTTNIRKISLQK